MPDYRVLIADASVGEADAELPANDLSFSRVLSGVGSLSMSIPIDHPAATEQILGQRRGESDREITVLRNDVAVWNGPLTGTDCSLSSGVITIDAREASWYLGKRVLEENKSYAGDDLFDIVRDLVSYMKNKTATGDDGMTLGDDIIADLPRFGVTAGDAGATLAALNDPTFAAASWRTIQDCMELLAADPETGFEWRMDYRTSSTRQSCQRTLTLGYPSLGSTLTTELRQNVLIDYSRTMDWERAATRVHVLGNGATKTLQSVASVTNDVLLLESVENLTDVSDEDVLTAHSREFRRISRPPVRTFTVSFVPGSALAFDFCELGDTVPFEITWPQILSITTDTRRVVQIDVTPDDGGREVVKLTFNDRLDDLGD